jgi:hypothetical protein
METNDVGGNGTKKGEKTGGWHERIAPSDQWEVKMVGTFLITTAVTLLCI